MTDGALTGLLVIDLSQGIAGGYCTKLLADAGADVIKIEPPEGDPLRRAGSNPSAGAHPERAPLFLHLSTGKKSVTLDIFSPAGAETLRRLLGRADAVVESFPPNHLSTVGLGYDDLKDDLPDLIYCSVTPYGQDGPWRDYKGNGFTAWATGGLGYVTGDPDREPLANGVDAAEYLAGVNAAIGIMAALSYRAAYGGGQHVDVSLMESVAANLEYTTALYSFQGIIRRRWYSRHLFRYPSDIFPCKNGHVVVVYGYLGLQRVAVLIGRPDMIDDPLFTSFQERARRWPEFEQVLDPYLMSHTDHEIVEAGQELHEPFALVLDLAGLLEDPHLRERGFFVEVDQPLAGRLLHPGAPFRLSATPLRISRAPLLGEHNEDVLSG